MSDYKVVPHEELDGIYEVGGWAFDLEEETGDADLAYVDNAIASWQAWREFLVHRENEKTQETLF